VGVAHRHAGDSQPPAGDFKSRVRRRVSGQRRRNLTARENWLAHVHSNAIYVASFEHQLELKRSPRRHDVERLATSDALVVYIFGHAADAVAAHLRVRAVGVEHPHLSIGVVGRTDQNQSIAADAKMPIGDRASHCRRVSGNRLSKAIDIDVVVAGAVHLGEFHTSAF
jgi:hypothetical protein